MGPGCMSSSSKLRSPPRAKPELDPDRGRLPDRDRTLGMRIVLILGTALLATLPSILIAKIWLRRKGIDPGSNTVQTFMDHAPTPLKAGLIAMNFVNFTILCGLGWWGLSALADGE